MSQRTDRVDELLRQEIGALLAKEVADPRIGFATITEVETSPDLGHAKVWVSVIGGKADRDETLRALQQAMGFVRHELGRRLRIRRIPELHVRLDDSAERGDARAARAQRARGRHGPARDRAVRRVAAHARSRGCPTKATPTTRTSRRPRPRPPRRRPGDRRRGAASPGRGRRPCAEGPRRQAGSARSASGRPSPGKSRQPPRMTHRRRPRRRGARRPSRDAVVERLRAARDVLAVGHENPDADTLGATLARLPARRGASVAARRPCSPTRPRRSTRSCRASTASATDPDPGRTYDLLVLSDCATAERVGDVAIRHRRRCSRDVPRIVIDHHASNDAAGRGDWVDPDAAATCEIVALLAIRLGVPLGTADGALATALMAGIVIDTATFAHPNATPRTLAVSAALVDVGAPLSDISRRLYRSKPDAQLRLFGRVLGRLQASGDGLVIWSTLLLEDLASTGAIPAHSEGIIDLLAQSETAEVAMLLKEQPDGTTRLSVRTKPGGVDATVLTGEFGGGGHARASGATMAMPVAEAVVAADAVARRLAAGRAPMRRRAERRPRRRPRRRQALGSHLARRRRAGPAPVARPGAWAMAARSTRSRRACCPCSSGAQPGSWSTTSARPRPIARRSASASSRRRTTSTAQRTPVDGPPVTREAVEAALATFIGPISQVPPNYSAVQIQGRRAYQLARSGETVVLAARDVTIHALELLEWDDARSRAADRRRRRLVLRRHVHPRARAGPRGAARDRRLPRRPGADRVGRVPAGGRRRPRRPA